MNFVNIFVVEIVKFIINIVFLKNTQMYPLVKYNTNVNSYNLVYNNFF